ncbi:hypothetical protein ACIG5E_20880 [Kitasatospora sp. NPDC053057]|uniref:hypothetical protein n=1 Tax=Kitasatospora sp. NPDC053057 TaxID=3364062 RepID=UPI0037C93E73
MITEVRGVTAPARFSRLPDAMAALLKTLSALPLSPDQQGYSLAGSRCVVHVLRDSVRAVRVFRTARTRGLLGTPYPPLAVVCAPSAVLVWRGRAAG